MKEEELVPLRESCRVHCAILSGEVIVRRFYSILDDIRADRSAIEFATRLRGFQLERVGSWGRWQHDSLDIAHVAIKAQDGS